MNFILNILESLVIAVLLPMSGWRLLHYFQLESYQLPGFFRSVKRSAKKTLLPWAVMGALLFFLALIGLPEILRLVMMGAGAVLLFIRAKNEKLKKPFVLTERVKRLIQNMPNRVMLSAGSRPYISVALSGRQPLEVLEDALKILCDDEKVG